MRSITLTAPAKVNLFLKVLNRRKDGYHNILTLFERISLSDKITISKIPSGIIVTSDKFITSNPKDNLAYKAAESIIGCGGLKGEYEGVRIRVRKVIPIAAGLGGGSSDAAAVLVGHNVPSHLKGDRRVIARRVQHIRPDIYDLMPERPQG